MESRTLILAEIVAGRLLLGCECGKDCGFVSGECFAQFGSQRSLGRVNLQPAAVVVFEGELDAKLGARLH